MPCNLICQRFLRNIARWYGRTSTGARRWKGLKDSYDDRVYDFRVAKRVPSSTMAPLSEEYIRCGPCDIVLLKSKFEYCPCCGNNRLTKSHLSAGRAANNYLAKRY